MKERQKRRTPMQEASRRSGIALLLAALLLAGGRIGTSAAEQEEAHDGARSAAAETQTMALRSASAEGRARDTVTTVYLDGREILVGDCVIRDSITYVPLRNFCNLFEDCKITWDAKTYTATVKTDDLIKLCQHLVHMCYVITAIPDMTGIQTNTQIIPAEGPPTGPALIFAFSTFCVEIPRDFKKEAAALLADSFAPFMRFCWLFSSCEREDPIGKTTSFGKTREEGSK